MHEENDFAVDLTNCDREPIHIPGAIQPHGVLLALREPDLAVTQVSENVSGLFGHDASAMLERPLSAFLATEFFAMVLRATEQETLAEINPLPLVVREQACAGILHRHEGVLILEIEPTVAARASERTHHPLRRAVAQLQSATTRQALYEAAVQAVAGLTGFERVMVYRFDEEGHGSVEAEVRPEAFDSYLGLHYPASDIPQQARQLYLRNSIRIIPDARYTPVALLPALRPDTGAPLDLSYSVLRSVSPIHLEYLENLGVRGSMSMSLIVRDRLWGLISCNNHSGPCHVPYETRSDCELLAHITAMLIAAFEDREIAAGRERRRPMLDTLAHAMRAEDDVLAALLAPERELFALLRIDGAAVVDDEVQTKGRVPPIADIRQLADWLERESEPGIFMSDALAKLAPEFASIKDVASGVISFALPGPRRLRFLGFRPEILQTVDWGGDPRKPVDADASARLHPRRSFALWREQVSLSSLPWDASDREAAEELRRVVVEVDLEKQVRREQNAVRARDDMVAVVSHDLRNPLNVIRIQGLLLRNLEGAASAGLASTLRAGVDRIQRSADRMNALIDDLLDLAKIEAGRFVLRQQREAVREILGEALDLLRPLADEKGIAVDVDDQAGLHVHADRARVLQVLSNLIGNAIKFTPGGGRVTVRVASGNGRVLFVVSDNGPGVAPEQIPQLFNRYWQASRGDREGAGLGLYIAKGIVEEHGGSIWAEQADGGGATFKFTMPLAP